MDNQLEGKLNQILNDNVQIKETNLNQISSLLKLSVYSSLNKELYVFHKSSSQKKYSNSLSGSTPGGESNYKLIIISFDSSQGKCVLKDTIPLDSISSDIKSIHLHSVNMNQLCFCTSFDLYCINDIKNKPNEIKKLHTKKDEIKAFKWSYFDNYYGVLYNKSLFTFNSIYSDEDISIVSMLSDDNVIDFSFCPLSDRGFEIFHVFFITQKGIIKICGPIIPPEFSISSLYFFNMKNYLTAQFTKYQNMTESQLMGESNFKSTLLGMYILKELTECKVKENAKEEKVNIVINANLESLNQNVAKKILFIQSDLMNNTKESINETQYKQMIVLDKRPITILRVSTDNVIDVIVVSDDILPSKPTTMDFKGLINGSEGMSNFLVEKINLGIKGDITVNDISKENGINTCVIICSNNDSYKIELGYIDVFSNIINGIYQEGDNKLYDFHSKITEMVSVNGKKTKIIKTKEKKDIIKKEEKPVIGLNNSSGGLLGNSNIEPTKSVFGTTQNKSSNIFGASNEQPANLFGGGNTKTTQPSPLIGNSTNNQPSGGLFQGTSNNNNKPSSLFGGGANNNNQSSGLFGSSNNNSKPSGGLFGGGNTNINQPTGLFGSNNNNQQSSLFGEKKSPLFGTGNTQPLFGSNNQQGPSFGTKSNTSSSLSNEAKSSFTVSKPSLSLQSNSSSSTDNKPLQIVFYCLPLSQDQLLYISSVNQKLTTRLHYINNINNKSTEESLKSSLMSIPSHIETKEKIEKLSSEISTYKFIDNSQLKNSSISFKKEYLKQDNIEKLLSTQIDNLSILYENSCNENVSNMLSRCDIMLDILSQLDLYGIDKEYERLMNIFNEIEIKSKLMKENSEKIKSLINTIREQVENINMQSRDITHYLSVIENFERVNKENFSRFESDFDKIKESFKAITQDRTSICKEYPEELSFNDDLIKKDLKQKKELVLNEILNIKAKIKMSQSKLINNTNALIMNK